MSGFPIKLHLGCGRQYLDGYVNIDYPASAHSVQRDLVADVYCDLVKLVYKNDSVQEIRLHHVFEHFPRQTALGLLCRWRDWLVVGGTIRIETPDLMACCRAMFSPFRSFASKQETLRHLFGSHESFWAAHWDGWYEEKFRQTLTELGFGNLRFSKVKDRTLRNIEVTAEKTVEARDPVAYRVAVAKLLRLSTIKFSQSPSAELPSSESEMLENWLTDWEAVYRGRSDAVAHMIPPDTARKVAD